METIHSPEVLVGMFFKWANSSETSFEIGMSASHQWPY